MEAKLNEYPQLTVECKIFRARLMEKTCEMNQQIARRTAKRIRKCTPGSVISIPDRDLDRLAGCCQCEKMSGENLQTVTVEALVRNVTVLVDRVLDENYTHDEEEQREKERERHRRYKEKRTRSQRFAGFLKSLSV